MPNNPIRAALTALCAAALLASCAWSDKSNWFLMDAGYSINAADNDEFAVEVARDVLARLGTLAVRRGRLLHSVHEPLDHHLRSLHGAMRLRRSRLIGGLAEEPRRYARR